ncbi:putative cadherin [Schistosoma mansoni]|uniref:putative cadherin n=1 Tax=Schistosoma mansoni TaxID=6183 RepID=UPI0001A62D83|nr:putative cadherin [Schistosoma mansoni]|eukprot:XP_018655236.1 putative cadherin [Schistosoma mansoni]
MNYLYSHYYQLKLILWIFYWVLLLSGKCLAVDEIELRLRMREEIAPSTRIGSVISSLPVNLRSQMHFLTDSTFFTVTPTTGEIRVGRLIDRERLCPEFKLCCGVITCELKASIFVTNKAAGEFAASVLLKVEIQDQNDNRPTFSAQSQTVTLSEATTVGTLISINAATDADIDPENQIQRYTLVEHTGTFKLDLSGLPTVRLELLRPLDREQVSEYKASLEACDPGACTRQTLEIQILDENDNSPRLANTRFNKRLIENIPVGTVVLQLNATDIDSGERGRVMYSFHGNIDSDLTETFELVRDTGEIKLRRPLAANIRDSYEFKVIACDAVNRACSGNENSTADITFTVEDVNNFPPSIHAVAAGAALVTSSSDQNKVAVLTVRDDDTGDNSKVSCSLNDTNSNILSNGEKTTQNFILTPSTPGIYSLRTAKVFDYESESTIRTTVVCHDYGKPQQLTSARVITVQIIDVNEFQPEFSRRVYVSGVPENAPPGMDILTTTALDRDRAAVLSYKFAPSSTLSFSEGEKDSHKSDSIQIDDEVNKHFIIESQTGIIRTSQIPLDREKIGSVTLVVLVTDSVSPPIFTATTTVSIEILDENDNAPVFTNPPVRSSEAPQGDNEKFAFTIMENAPRFTQLSQRLEAKDPDQGDNGRVQFSLLATYALTKSSRRNQFIGSSPNMLTSFEHFIDRPGSDLNSEAGMTRHVVDQPIFRITSNGVIETLVELDRETVPVYILKIGVRDRGAQPLASTTMLRVNVQDANDNAPTLTRTRGSVGQSVFAAPPGCAIAYEPHLDADSGDSGRGPSEEGNQFLLSDNYRNGMNIPGQHGTYQYNTYSGYRPSSRIGYYRNPSLDNTGSLTKIHSIACQNPTPGGSCACYIVSDNTIIQPVAQYGNNNGPGIAYHPEHASPQKIMPLTLEQQQMEHSRGEHSLPPIPPPRSPQMPSSTVTLRKNCTTNIPSGLSKYNESPTKVNSRASGLYPHSENSHELIHSNNNFDHNGFNQPDDQSSNIIQTPLRIDLRGQSTTDFNTSENNYDTASKQHRLVRNGLGIGLPPLASNYALNQPVNIQPKQKSNPLSNPELQLTV